MKSIQTIGAACIAAILSLLFLNIHSTAASEATNLPLTITTSNGASSGDMSDDSYTTLSTFQSGDTIIVTSDTPISSLYIVWNNQTVSPWTLTYNEVTQNCGQEGYLHEYVLLQEETTSLTIHIEANDAQIAKFYGFSAGDRPSWVQDWSAPCDKADFLLISTHADDEHLFFGGILPYYAGELGLSVQVVYFTNYWNGANIREHEKLDGLWTVGVTNYPVNGEFDDLYSETLEQAKEVYRYEDTLAFIVEQIRRFQPLVLVGQDLNGEYGHGAHMLTASAITEAITISNQTDSYPDSADLYGVYQVPKTYLHLYTENQINLDCRRALSRFNGKTVLEVAQEGYLMHQSQQWCWFYVDDSYEYSCGRFGLYQSTVGADTGNDMLENLITYEEQQQLAEEESSKEAASVEASMEAASIEQSKVDASESASESQHDAQIAKNNYKLMTYLAIGLGCLGLLIFVGTVLSFRSAQKKRRKRRIHD